jgi:hypothetical protein
MFEREEDARKIWMENLTDAEYEAYKASRAREELEHIERLNSRS